MGNHENKKARRKSDNPVQRFSLDGFSKDDPPGDIFQCHSENKAYRYTPQFRPSEMLRKCIAEAIAERRNESDHDIIDRKQFSHRCFVLPPILCTPSP
jgi:hypothetical protein